ncbi:ABC transporter substrate-binding protein [Clostridium sp. WLY-B-L2]|uniref:ABC transporter substrate-binding protein n=1 Tax=Clostridium aromativorans TaxID=2836848 RepID=A0ABS8N0Q6_9CLOT|nr:ABC transporter substrate-binding protein [Clostridium aromativorans]MCC9293379.1 ABC transporter substrate-binding protein [Clostridium aromativorans]
MRKCMLHRNKIIIFFLTLILLFNLSACGGNSNASDDGQINLYIGVKDRESLNMIKYIINEYKKANPKVELNVDNSIGEKIDGDINDNSNMDVVFISRTDMLNLVRKSALSDMRNLYRENNLNERYYSVSKSFGRFNDRYYGIAIFPYTIEILCNEDAFNKLNLKMPNSMNEFMGSLKALNSLQKRVPVVLNEDVDINTALFSIVSNNLISMKKLEDIYDSGPSAYKSLGEMQECFHRLNDMVKNGYVNKDTFEIGNGSTIQKFNGNDIPVIITSSYYINDIKNTRIKCLQYDNSASDNVKVPVMADVIMSTPVNSKNMDQINDFIKFILSDNIQKKLYNKGFITGNRKVNTPKKGINKSIIEHLKNSTEDNIAVIYNMPKNFRYSISLKIDDIFSGKYTGNEWNEVVEESY